MYKYLFTVLKICTSFKCNLYIVKSEIHYLPFSPITLTNFLRTCNVSIPGIAAGYLNLIDAIFLSTYDTSEVFGECTLLI